MCVMLCANPKVQAWLEISLARSCRETYRLCALRPDDPEVGPCDRDKGAAKPRAAIHRLDNASERRIMKRSAWVQAYCRQLAHRRASPQDWHKTFDALADAWGRFLSLVGLRR